MRSIFLPDKLFVICETHVGLAGWDFSRDLYVHQHCGGGGPKGGGGMFCNAVIPRILVAVRRFLSRGAGSYIGNN
jgi:hypothetical protein